MCFFYFLGVWMFDIYQKCSHYRYLFDMSKLEAEELKTIQKTDVVNLYNTYFRSQSPKCRRLAIHVWGCKADTHGGAQTKDFGKEIDDVDSFKRHSKFYSSLCWNSPWTANRFKAFKFLRASQVFMRKFGNLRLNNPFAKYYSFIKRCNKSLWSLYYCTLILCNWKFLKAK